MTCNNVRADTALVVFEMRNNAQESGSNLVFFLVNQKQFIEALLAVTLKIRDRYLKRKC